MLFLQEKFLTAVYFSSPEYYISLFTAVILFELQDSGIA